MDKSYSLKGILKTIGPGIIYAGAAIGVSHLVQSTRAGALYGFEIIWAIILINIFKYPFFEYAYRYTAATGESVLDGYRKLGSWAIWSFFGLSIFTAIFTYAAVALVTSGLASYLFSINLTQFEVNFLLLVIVFVILLLGSYSKLDKLMKMMVVLLSVGTIFAFFMAIGKNPDPVDGFTPTELWNTGGIMFLIALMGWMPTPIEVSVWPSLWSIEHQKNNKYKPTFKEILFDFNIGFVGSGFLAVFFLGLGALVMYGTGEVFSNSNIKFSEQLVSLYANTLGEWSRPVISTIAMLTMLTTTITVFDGYPRTLEAAMKEIWPRFKKEPMNWVSKNLYWLWAILLSITTMLIVGWFTDSMKQLAQMAMIISFIAAPFFAAINFKIVTSDFMPEDYKPGVKMRILSFAGIIFLSVFCLIFFYYFFIV